MFEPLLQSALEKLGEESTALVVHSGGLLFGFFTSRKKINLIPRYFDLNQLSAECINMLESAKKSSGLLYAGKTLELVVATMDGLTLIRSLQKACILAVLTSPRVDLCRLRCQTKWMARKLNVELENL